MVVGGSNRIEFSNLPLRTRLVSGQLVTVPEGAAGIRLSRAPHLEQNRYFTRFSWAQAEQCSVLTGPPVADCCKAFVLQPPTWSRRK
jgi:hypothetical protein